MRPCLWGAVLGAALAIAAGCGTGEGKSGGGEGRDEKYLAYARQYGQLLFKRDFGAAYELCSSHLKSRMTLEQFGSGHLEAFKTYGEPDKFEVGLNFAKPELLKGHKGFGGAPPEIRQARVFVYFGTKQDAEARDGYCCGLDIVEENGRDLVASFDYSINH